MIKLYGNPASTCTRKVLTALAETDTPYELHIVDLGKGEHKKEPNLVRQPFGQIPAIDDDGFESAAREFADSGVSVTAKFHSNFQITEDPSQDPCGLVVRAQNQSLQTHR